MAYTGHTSGANVVIVVTTFTVTAVLCCILRLWTRLRISRQAGIDDALAAVAACLNILVNACMCMQVKYGLGRHMDTLTPNELVHALIWFYISISAYTSSLGIIKLSIVCQCLRVFGHIHWYRKASIVMIITLVIFTTWSTLMNLFLCQPVNHFWHPKSTGKCMDKLAIWFFVAIFSILTDIITAVLPVTVLRSLQLPRKQRILLSCVFALGGVVCVISFVRFHALYAIAKSRDISYDNPLAALWATIEINVGLIACSLPILKGLVCRYFPKALETAHRVEHKLPGFPTSRNRSGMIRIWLLSGSCGVNCLGTAECRRAWPPRSEILIVAKLLGRKRSLRSPLTTAS
ncbi:hypothetical protein CERZMDRAFT_31683 [Cercospora zeae-maydis SCOH1-5]|uniref:Rhodopsin domain-containing protein n=1 Tax=Cercospora zeae-maydis SCOH1-5 TaxID=717836 RepID=A0A6A6FWI7_9PEZI|nr:hypothetical protein CERZMDRAFT_31683 [Cercospora zeae-maydis SCOH1-5]